jgi:uncharacterized protein YbjT (DUF2867 family)
MSKTLLITGATGNQGGAVIRALLADPEASTAFSILALTRNTHSTPAAALAAKYPTIKLIEGNLDDPQAIFTQAATPIFGVFSVQNSMIRGSSNEIEERQGKDLIDAAIKNNVKHFVYASVDRHGKRSDTDPTNVPHFANKYRIEKYLQKKSAAAGGSMTWTILRPTGFMENFASPPFAPAFMGKVFASVWRYAIPEDVPMQLISVVDIGWFGAQAFLRSQSKEYRNTAISLAADELTFTEASKVCKEKTGFEMAAMPNIVAWGVLKVMGDVRVMFEWFAKERLDADIVECRRLHPKMMNFGDWVERESGFVKK